jgi:hypothetical protein
MDLEQNSNYMWAKNHIVPETGFVSMFQQKVEREILHW